MFVKFVKDDKVVQEVSISPEMIPFPTDTVALEVGKFTVESREYDDAMLAYKKHYDNTIDLLVEDFFKMKELLQDDSKLQAVKHVKDFVDTYCDYIL